MKVSPYDLELKKQPHNPISPNRYGFRGDPHRRTELLGSDDRSGVRGLFQRFRGCPPQAVVEFFRNQ